MREDDVEAQIALVDRVVNGNYQGLILAPNQAVSLISPVRRALAHGIRTVIIGSPLRIPAQENLIYVLNDDVESGRLAAKRVALRLKGHGTVALLGINPDMTGVMIRARAFERYLEQNYPGIRVAERRMGTFNVSHEQQVAEDTLRDHPDLNMVVALIPSTVEGSLAAVKLVPSRHPIKVIGFDSPILPSVDPETSTLSYQDDDLDCVIEQDTPGMTQRAIKLIQASLLSQPVPSTTTVNPILITAESSEAYLPQILNAIRNEQENIRSRWTIQ
jgi:ribose transport system substrate-binding protein